MRVAHKVGQNHTLRAKPQTCRRDNLEIYAIPYYVITEAQSMAREMIKNQLPFGGAVDIHGKIVWRVTEEEFQELKRHLDNVFSEDGEQ